MQFVQYAKDLSNNNRKTLGQGGAEVIIPSVNAMFSIGGPIVYAWPPRIFLVGPVEKFLINAGDYNFTYYLDGYASLGMVMFGTANFFGSTNGAKTYVIMDGGFIFICFGYIGVFLDFFVYTPYAPNEKPRKLAELMFSLSLGSAVISY